MKLAKKKIYGERNQTIKNLKKAATRIKKAVKNKEKIIIYGDADPDGVCSVIILQEAIRNLGGAAPIVYFPDREIEGYGINKDALSYLKKEAPALFISVDCGIGNFEEINLAQKLGFETIIVDHHEALHKLPKAKIIVDPHQKGDKYPFKRFAAAGIVFKLAEELLKKQLPDSLRNNFLELAALATIADMMPQTDDNLDILEQGLASLAKTFRPGLRVFLKVNSLPGLPPDNARQLAQKIISACNAGETRNHINECYRLLTETSEGEAEVLARNLLEKASLRQLKIKQVTEEIEQRILRKLEEPIVFEGDKNWEVLMLGPAASRICQNFPKPIFLYAEREKESQGAVRTPSGVDGVEMMKKCSHLLGTYGGHPQAAGFKIKNKNLEKFKSCLLSDNQPAR